MMIATETYPKEVVNAEHQVAASCIGIHHELQVDVEAKGVREKKHNIAIGEFGVGCGNVGIDTINLDNLACGLAIVEVTFEAAKVGWLCEDGVDR